MSPRNLDTLVRIERPVADGAFDGAGAGSWTLVASVWARIRDMPLNRPERLAEGVNVSARPATVRIRRRGDVDTSMRIVHGARIMQITAGPAEVERDYHDFMTQNFAVAGNGA